MEKKSFISRIERLKIIADSIEKCEIEEAIELYKEAKQLAKELSEELTSYSDLLKEENL